MKQICEVVRDLFLLYDEGECGEGTKQFVETHLSECEECRRFRESLCLPEELAVIEPEVDYQKEEKIVKKSFRKIRNRWAASIIAVLMVFPIAGVAILGVNEAKGEGICFSNWKEIAVAKKFAKLLEQEQYAKAAEMLDYSASYYDIKSAEEEIGISYYDTAILVDLGGETWAVTPEFAENNHIAEDGTYVTDFSKRNFWMNIIYNYQNEVWVPEEIWDEMVDDFEVQDVWNMEVYVPRRMLGEELIYEAQYCYLETQWGNYYIDSSYGTLLEQETVSAADIIYHTPLAKGEIYEAAKEQVAADLEARAERFYEMYAEALAMTEEEYEKARKDDFVKRLENYKKEGWTIRYRGFDDAYRCIDYWQIELKVKENKLPDVNASLLLKVEGDVISGYVGSKGENYMSDVALGLIRYLEIRGE